MTVRSVLACAGAATLAFGVVAAAAQHARANAYPTDVVADYVIGCMAANGETQEMLRRCSCSIDAVASILPYDTYERAETIIRMSNVAGGNTEVFRTTSMLKRVVDRLRLAQIEADFRCF